MATTVVIGSDSGVGFEVAKRFGKGGQRIILVSRNQTKLNDATDKLIELGVLAGNYVCDANDFKAVVQMMKDLTDKYEDITNLVFNVGNKHLDDALSSDISLIEDIFKTNVTSAIVSARSFLKYTNSDLQRAIIFTGGGAAIRPSEKASTLSLTKAALRSYAYTLHDKVASQNVYVGLVTIQGLIGTSAEMAPENIAETYWQMLQQRQPVETFYPKHVLGSEFK